MADEKKVVKPRAVDAFRAKLRNKEQAQATVLEGLASTNSKVRSLASKMAFKLKDHEFIKKNVMPLVSSDKSKKVLRSISDKITRKSLLKKVQGLLAKKAKPEEKKTEAGEVPKS